MDYRKKIEEIMELGITMKFISYKTNINIGTLYNYISNEQNLSKEKEEKLFYFINDFEVFLGVE
jgi:hypothetical protein